MAYKSGSIDQPSFGMQAWMVDAHCRGANAAAFFPSDGTGVEAAQHVCADCPVQIDCLEYALTMRLDHGVWGGTSERERQRILRERRDNRPSSDQPGSYAPREN